MAVDTTASSYWLNWRFFLCALWLLASLVACAYIIWKYEGPKKSKTETKESSREGPETETKESSRETVGLLYKNEAWKTLFKVVHPGWLLAYRMIAFSVLLSLLILNIVLYGGTIMIFYTQWTFLLVTIYFAFASLFSIYGCFLSGKKSGVIHPNLDAEIGATDLQKENTFKSLKSNEEFVVTNIANKWGYSFQIFYQICGGSVVLTDCVFWCILYPFVIDNDHSLPLIDILFHSMNAVFLLGDMLLNSVRFPFFRIAYFILWTGIYVTFQWIIHVFINFWWPYPFLDLSSPHAPLWYVAVGLLHLPCYGAFALIVKLKHFCFSRLFPNAYQGIR